VTIDQAQPQIARQHLGFYLMERLELFPALRVIDAGGTAMGWFITVMTELSLP